VTSRLTHALPVLLMLLLGGLTLWLRQAIEAPGPVSRAPALHDPDSAVEKFTVTRLGADGAPEATLSAQRMVHYGDDDSTELQLPELIKNDPAATLTVRANRGVVTRDYEEAQFYDNVQLVRTQKDAADPLRVRSDYLHVLIKSDVVRSDRPVTITQGSSTLSGTGMEYDRKSGRLSVLSDVRASFDAKRR
jgi:lipopolysaccharide export system protein LptC